MPLEMPLESLVLLILILAAGLYMAWSIGANDVANAMGTSVGSGALTLRQAVVVAAILEFSGAFFFGSNVSETIQRGIVRMDIFQLDYRLLVYGMLASLLASGAWLQLASYNGWPVSTTHSIVGAVVGFGAIIGGLDAIYWGNVAFIVTSWIASPLIGGFISYMIFQALRHKIFYSPDPVEATKQLTPFMVAGVIATLSLILVYKGIPGLKENLSLIEMLFWITIPSALGAGLSYLLVRRIVSPSAERPPQQPLYGPEIATELDKASKHLKRVHDASHGEVHYKTSLMLEEVKELSQSLRETPIDVGETDYLIVEKIFGYLQLMSACLMAFAHGANDVANAIGPLSAAVTTLMTQSVTSSAPIPAWSLALGGFGIVIGLATWGWRVIETIGKKITELTPTRGFAAEFGAATTILLASRLGLPISTTHTLVGSVIGVGMARGFEALDLSTMRTIVISWVVTVPAGAIASIFFFEIIDWAFS